MHLFKNIQKNEPVAVNYVTFAIAQAFEIGKKQFIFDTSDDDFLNSACYVCN